MTAKILREMFQRSLEDLQNICAHTEMIASPEGYLCMCCEKIFPIDGVKVIRHSDTCMIDDCYGTEN